MVRQIVLGVCGHEISFWSLTIKKIFWLVYYSGSTHCVVCIEIASRSSRVISGAFESSFVPVAFKS